MNPRVLVPGLLVISAITVLIILTGGGGGGVIDDSPRPSRDGDGTSISDPLAEALSYLPSSPDAVATVQTGLDRAPGSTASDLVASLPSEALGLGSSSDLDSSDGAREDGLAGIAAQVAALRPLFANPIVIAVPSGGAEREGSGDEDEDGDAGGLGALPLAGEARVAWVTSDAGALQAFIDGQVSGGDLESAGEEGGHRLYRRSAGPAYATRGPVLVVAPDVADLRAAIELHRQEGDDGAKSLSTGALRDYFGGLPGPGESVVRVSATRDGIVRGLPGLAPLARASTWTEAVSRVAFALVPRDDGLRVPFRVSTGAADIGEDALPIASGGQAPEPAGDGTAVLAIRDAGQTLGFVRGLLEAGDQATAGRIDQIEGALSRFANVDLRADLLRRLDATATLSYDGEELTLRADTTDPNGVADALRRARGALQSARVDLGGFALEDHGGRSDFDDDDGFNGDRGGFSGDPSDRYRLTRNGDPVATVGVAGDALVVTTDEFVDLESTVDAFPEVVRDRSSGDDGNDEDSQGALFARVSRTNLGGLLGGPLGLSEAARTLLGAFDGLRLNATADTSRIEGVLTLALD